MWFCKTCPVSRFSAGRRAGEGTLLEDAQAALTCPAILLGEAGDTAYRLRTATERSQKLETQLSVREAAKGVGEEEKEGGKGTQESRNHRDASGAGGCRAAGQGIAIRGHTVYWRAPSVAWQGRGLKDRSVSAVAMR